MIPRCSSQPPPSWVDGNTTFYNLWIKVTSFMSLSSVSPLICQDSLMLLFMSCIDGLVSQTHLDSSQLMHRSFPWCRASKNGSSMGTSKVWPKKQHLFQQSLFLNKKTDGNKKKRVPLDFLGLPHTSNRRCVSSRVSLNNAQQFHPFTSTRIPHIPLFY